MEANGKNFASIIGKTLILVYVLQHNFKFQRELYFFLYISLLANIL